MKLDIKFLLAIAISWASFITLEHFRLASHVSVLDERQKSLVEEIQAMQKSYDKFMLGVTLQIVGRQYESK